jgi:Tfp pilus assembly protein PilV
VPINSFVARIAPHQLLAFGRVRRAVARLAHRAEPGQAGFSLIEVVLALVLLLAALTATSSLVASALRVGGNSRLKQVATDIASSQLDSDVQSGAAALLNQETYSGSISRGGVKYTIERNVTPGNGACVAPQPGQPIELKLTVWVTWASTASGQWWDGGSATSKLVQESTLVAVPATALTAGDGSILVAVTDDAGNGQAGVKVTLSPGGEFVYTSDAGCAFFPNLVPPGPYSVTANKAGWIDSNNDVDSGFNPVPPTWSGTVIANQVLDLPLVAPLYYAQAGTVTATYSVPNVNGVAPRLPDNTSLLPLSFYNGNMSRNPDIAPNPAELFPFSTSYTAVVGSCGSDSAPDGTSTDGQTVSVTPGSQSYPNFTLSPVDVVVTDTHGAQQSGATVTASASTPTGGADSSCNTVAMPLLGLGTTGPVQMAYHPSVGASPGATLTSWLGASHLRTSRSVGRGEAAARHPTDVQTSLLSLTQRSSPQRPVPDSHATRSSDVKSSRRTDVHSYAVLTSKTTTHTTLTSSANTSVHGQLVTFTAAVAAVSPGTRTPTGTVKFKDGGTVLGTGTLRNGVTSYTISTLAVGPRHVVTAVYGGDTNFTGSRSKALSRRVHKTTTHTTLTSSANTSVHGQLVTFTAAVAAISPGTGTPTGTVKFKDGRKTVYARILSNGFASYTASTLAVGSKHSVTVVYGGDTNFTGSTSGALYRQVQQANTTTALVSSANPASSASPVNLIATVVPTSPGAGTPIGTVTFKDGSTVLHTGTLSQGVVSFATSTLAVGPRHSVTAVYGGNTNFTSSTSSALSQVVLVSFAESYRNAHDGYVASPLVSNEAILVSLHGGLSHESTAQLVATSTTTTLTSSANPSVYGQSVTFTATVSSSAATGTVTFEDGSTAIGTGTLSGGVATYTTGALTVATHTIKAVYAGDSNYKTSTSTAVSQKVQKASTTTTLTSSTNPSVYGQAVTFTATVVATSPGAGTPTGTVTFKNGSTTLGTGTLSGGVATYTTGALAIGTLSITAVYGGDTNFTTSTSSALSQVVNKASTTTTLTPSANPSVWGQPVMFTATVAAASPGAGTPTGTVTFYDGSTTLGTGTLSGGVATYTTSALSIGTHSITAVYGGNTNFTSSTSSALSQVVNQASTTTTLTSSTNPSAYNQSVTFTATVAAASPGAGTPTGTVTFYDGSTTLGTGTLSNKVATYTTSALAIGTHSITAVYGGNTNFTSSTSSVLSQVVNKVGTTTTLTSSVNPSVYGQAVTFTATVGASAPGPGTPTGTVTFYDGSTALGTGTLSGGVATCTTGALAIGTRSITAVYGGDTNFTTSTSSALSQVVHQASTTTTVTSSANPSVYGQAVTFTATVTAASPGAGTPTGTVTFKDGSTALGTGTLSGGQATYTTGALAIATHSITAVYGGDTNFTSSTSSALSQVVNKASTTTTLNSSANPSVWGQPVTFTATVAAASPGAGTPTGTVTFYDGSTTLGTGTLSGGVATYTTSVLAIGTHSITAVYGGDTNFTGSTSSVLSQVVNQATLSVLSGLPYGMFLLGATCNNLSSTNSGTNVVVWVTASGVLVNDSVNGSVNWVPVPAGSSIVVPVA